MKTIGSAGGSIVVKRWIAAAAAALSLCLSLAAGAAELSAVEQRWLQGAWPVVAYAKAAQLPLDVVVQPQPAPDVAPLAMAFVGGRCKLVLSMRGNAEAQATLDRIEPELRDAALEMMAAHELGHCRRHLDGQWQLVPTGHAMHAPAELPDALRAAYAAMQATRREEAFADLVGLAWARREHPELYARLHGWLIAERSRDLIEGSHHDTLAWIREVDAGALVGANSIFATAESLWRQGFAIQP